jgi:hypothetical protein
MILDAKWAFLDNADTDDELIDVASNTEVHTQNIDLNATGFADGPQELFLNVQPWLVAASEQLTINLYSATDASQSADVNDRAVMSQIVPDTVVLAATAASRGVVQKMRLPPGLRRYIYVGLTNTVTSTTNTYKAWLSTS